MINFEGVCPPLERFKTGFWSLDQSLRNAAGEVGFPLRAMVEVYGATGVGKSTWTYTLASRINPEGKIVLADLEGLDPDYLKQILLFSHFDGTVEFVNEEKDELILDKLIATIAQDNSSAGILDSVGAISPIGERDGEVGEANMGRRAKLMAVLSRKAIYTLRMKKNPANIFIVNHVQQLIGGIAGTTTPGGDSKKYLSGIRIRLKNAERFEDGSYHVQGTVEKNRFGYGQKVFNMVCLAGKGYHEGLSAVVDCVALGIAKKERTIKMDENSYGFFSSLLEKARKDENDVFEIFKTKLNEFVR